MYRVVGKNLFIYFFTGILRVRKIIYRNREEKLYVVAVEKERGPIDAGRT